MSTTVWDWGEPVDYETRRVATARRERPCMICWTPINPGERYLAINQHKDESWQAFGLHLGCAS